MTETTESKYPDAEHAQPSRFTADRVANLVTELGVGWAKYGLTVGRLALRQSARVLESTSELLGDLAARVEKAAAPKQGEEIVTPVEEVKS